MNDTVYTLIPDCTLRKLGDKYVLMVYPLEAAPFALDVNGSFALLIKVAQCLIRFTAADLASALVKVYCIPPDKAASETEITLSLWRQHGLIE